MLRTNQRPVTIAVTLTATALLAGCGGHDKSSASTTAAATTSPAPVATTGSTAPASTSSTTQPSTPPQTPPPTQPPAPSYVYEVGAQQRYTSIEDALAAVTSDLGTSPFPSPVSVVVHDGTYRERILVPATLQPTQSSRLVIKAAVGARPVVDGEAIRDGATLRNTKHVTLSGLTFINGREFGVFLFGDSSDNVVEGCGFFKNSRSGVEFWEFNRDTTIKNCVFAGNGFGQVAQGARSGVGLNGWANTPNGRATNTITNVVVTNNTFFENNSDHVYSYSAAVTCTNNIYDGTSGGPGLGSPAEGNFLFGMGNPLFVNPSDDHTVADFHLQSTTGRYLNGAWVTDPQASPCIDFGDPASAVGNEPSPHGGRINAGAYGGTTEASQS